MITFLSSAVIARGAEPDRANAVAVAMRIPSRSSSVLCFRAPARRPNRPGPAHSPHLGDVAVADLSGAENAQLVVRLTSFDEGRWTFVAGGAGVTLARLSAILGGEDRIMECRTCDAFRPFSLLPPLP